MEALTHAPHVVRLVFLSNESANDRDLRDTLGKLNMPITNLKVKEAERMVGRDTSYQGVIAIADTSSLVIDFADFITSFKPTPDTMLVILDELTDPHNVGAIIRSAAAFGASGVLMPTHNQAPITGAVVKASAGMVFRVPLVSIGNVNYTITSLKKEGYWMYGLDMAGTADIAKEIFNAPAVFVVGNEGRGVRQKTIELCDVPLRIPMNPRCESLNASVSAAVVLYQWSVQHTKALK